MAVPKKKVSLRRRRIRRNSVVMNVVHVVSCKSCGAQKKLHYACPECGSPK